MCALRCFISALILGNQKNSQLRSCLSRKPERIPLELQLVNFLAGTDFSFVPHTSKRVGKMKGPCRRTQFLTFPSLFPSFLLVQLPLPSLIGLAPPISFTCSKRFRFQEISGVFFRILLYFSWVSLLIELCETIGRFSMRVSSKYRTIPLNPRSSVSSLRVFSRHKWARGMKRTILSPRLSENTHLHGNTWAF